MHWFIRGRVVVKAAIKAGLGSAAWAIAPRGDDRTVRALMYHRVNDHPRDEIGLVSQEISVSTAAFARQLDYLVTNRYHVLTAREAIAGLTGRTPLPPRSVLITFDDGYADNYTCAFPLLRARGLPAVIFLATDHVERGDPFPWDIGRDQRLSRPLTWSQVREMAANGIAFGSHTCSHARLDRLSPGERAAELEQSRIAIERHTGVSAELLAYPGGNFGRDVVDAVRRAGYEGAFTTIAGANRPGCDPLRLRRLEVSASDPLPVFALKVRGALDLLWVKDTALPVAARNWVARRFNA